jgi:hypothetical protein
MERKEMIEMLNANIILQARYFLEAADEFFPFGCSLSPANELRPMGVYFDEEHPSSVDVITELEKAIKDGLLNNRYRSAAIGVDVSINNGDDAKKVSALEIRFISNDFTEVNYFRYNKAGSSYVFERIKLSE